MSDSSACERRIRGRAICGASWTFVMQFFWNRMENDIDESVERLGELFESFLKKYTAEEIKQKRTPSMLTVK